MFTKLYELGVKVRKCEGVKVNKRSIVGLLGGRSILDSPKAQTGGVPSC